MLGVEGEGLDEGGGDTGNSLIIVDTGEAEAGVVVDGDVEGFSAGAFIAIRSVAGTADAGFVEAAQHLHVEVDQFAWRVSFVADDGRRTGEEIFHAIEAMALENVVHGGMRHAGELGDLRIAFALPAQGADLLLKEERCFARLVFGATEVFVEPITQAFLLGAFGPAAYGAITDSAGHCCGPQTQSKLIPLFDHLRSTERSKPCITVDVAHAEWL